MDAAVEVSHSVAEMLFGPNALVPWWAWLAPFGMVFLKLFSPFLFPEVVRDHAASERAEEKIRKPVKSRKK
ncbi:hypothetical protein [Actinoplanes flavus]|uniref:Uncharacterized protein n=1 Tax=Actinoplanes flavus TaxID=2820290 RepID=A0ABS3ULB1_9ACTN|nr:hypothetical protein [Actinoplanes flavus]MBO3738467.1 hypothetical protein [Actinoplanes flavus]